MYRKRILIFIDWFEPAFKAGGPVRSCVNFVNNMAADYDIFIFTGDRDLGDEGPFDNIMSNIWTAHYSGANVFYASPEHLKWKHVLSIMRDISPDYIYLNSVFSKHFTIYPILIKKIEKLKAEIILAPRGMLKDSALKFKSFKKRLFLILFKSLQLDKLIFFHVTSESEINDVKHHFSFFRGISYIPNYPAAQQDFSMPPPKERGKLNIIFIGRVHPIKNLHFLLESLLKLKSTVNLTIIGSIEDPVYWKKCTEIIKMLPPNVITNYLNEIEHNKLENIIKSHHLFCSPTSGENFGHAIFEALLLGRPVLISDQTPWKDLERKKIGWDIPLTKKSVFTEKIELASAMDYEELTAWCKASWTYCNNYIIKSDIRTKYLNLFH